MNRILYTFILLGACMIFGSCKQTTFDTKEALWTYLKDPENGYTHTKMIRGVRYTITYKPTDLLVDQELGGQQKEPRVIDDLRSKYSPYLYFTLSMAKNQQELLNTVAGDKQRFGAMVNQLAFGMEEKIHCFTPSKDTIALADYNYPRMYGMSGATTMLLVYPKEAAILNAEYINLTIEDLGLNTGEVRFKIPTDIIRSAPTLRF
ncbi:hypothetical protein HN014_00970 [Aquimarina sp. TRL1]|uniref:hypothetical protein n=1 Tax=Aquimarina sp. (strain TRL1) TaxID=2736252 RepID=UPI00158BAB27|nr:hypothetical protein [Aquimarina sp. TRL1]QKX03542.1 hypothetical protein HN014_00970 [Aquimarina sp. TRL1]